MIPRFAAVTLALACWLPAGAARANNFIEDSPARPADASRVQATVGVFLRYQLVANDLILSPRITIWDQVAGREREFSLSYKTTVNGKLLSCEGDQGIASMFNFAASAAAKAHLCGQLPSDLVPGKTAVVLLYWDHTPIEKNDPLVNFPDLNPATDAILTATPSPRN